MCTGRRPGRTRRLPAVPYTQRSALTGALGWTATEPGGDRFQVFAATHALVAAAAEDRPLLVIVDDVQWLDWNPPMQRSCLARPAPRG